VLLTDTACTAIHALASESTIRALLTAALLPVAAAEFAASSSPPSSTSSSAYSSADDEGPGPATARRGSQPDFAPLLPALRDAVAADPFWGPYHYSHLLGRARRFARAVAGPLARQAAALAAVVDAAAAQAASSLPESPRPKQLLRKPPLGPRARTADAAAAPFPPLIAVRAGAVARRQRLLGVVQRRGVEMALRERRMAVAAGGGAGKWTVPVGCRWAAAGLGVRPRSLTAP
jgi:hypothetical protein